MKFGARWLVLASTATLTSARLGSTEQTEHQGQRRLCGQKKDACSAFVNPCCDGLSCHLDGKCYRYPRQAGDPCVPYMEQCDDGTSCDLPSLKCRVVGTAVADKCNFSTPCEGSVNGKPLTCDLYTNTCRLPGGVGDGCHATRPCDDGLLCSSTTTLCQRPSGEGESCSVSQRCENGLSCDLTSSICRGKSPVGGKCHLSRRCESGLYCDLDSETCRDAAQVGEKCNVYVPCADGDLFCNDSDICEEKPTKCDLEGGDGCGGLDDDNIDGGGDGIDDDDGSVASEVGMKCNMATGQCDTPTPAPSPAPVTSTPTTRRPTELPTTESPTFKTSAPTGLLEKCPLTGCINKIPVQSKAPYAIEQRVSVLDAGRGGLGAMKYPDGGRRLEIELQEEP